MCNHTLVSPLISCLVSTVRRTLKSGLTSEEANALGLSGSPEMQVWAEPRDIWKPFHCPSSTSTRPGNPPHSSLAVNPPPSPFQLRWVDLVSLCLVRTSLTLPGESEWQVEHSFYSWAGWVGTQALHSNHYASLSADNCRWSHGSITIIWTWNCKDPRVSLSWEELAACLLQPLWPWLNAKGWDGGTDSTARV